MSGDRSGSPSLKFFVFAAAIVAAGTYAAVSSALPAWIGALAGLNAATILLYGYDKAVAGGTLPRVPEKVLLLLALLGGSPAALLSQTLFRHKTIAPLFRRMFWLVVALQLAAAAGGAWWWWHSRAS